MFGWLWNPLLGLAAAGSADFAGPHILHAIQYKLLRRLTTVNALLTVGFFFDAVGPPNPLCNRA